MRFSRRRNSLQQEATASNSPCVVGKTLKTVRVAIRSVAARCAGDIPTVYEVGVSATSSVDSSRTKHQASKNQLLHVNLLVKKLLLYNYGASL